MRKTSKRLRLWESALLLAFALTLTAGAWASASGGALADRVLRLHVVANSDTDRDQALKLTVRDAVLARAAPWLEGASGQADAEAALAPRLDELAETAADALRARGCDDPVSVAIEDVWFPTKQYDGFSLPAGRYRALRVVIGQGAGRNWWCVLFPPLCLGSVTEETAETALEGGLSEDQVSLMTGQDGGYVLKFKVIEWWNELMDKLGL